MALFILKENIHLGVCSLAATRPFWRFRYLLLGQKGISLLTLLEKSPEFHYNGFRMMWEIFFDLGISLRIPFTNVLKFHKLVL